VRHASFFSGVGGLDLGFERAGIETVSVCEIDKYASAVLAERFPSAPNLGSITEVEANDIPEADIWSGGFPCQDLSVAGKRAGFAGKRSSLAFTFLDLVEQRKPRWIVLENVPGLFSSNKGADFGRLLYEMEQLGYGVAWRTLDARYFGVAQRRRRVFLVGSLGSDRAGEVLLECEGCERHPATRRASWQATARGAQDGSGIAGALTRRFSKGVNSTIDEPLIISSAADADGVRAADGLARRLDNQPGLEDPQRVGNFEMYDFPNDSVAPSMNALRARDLMAYQTRVDEKNGNFSLSEADVANSLSALWPSDTSHRSMTLIAPSEPVLSFPSRFGSNANVTENQAQSMAHSAGAPAVLLDSKGGTQEAQDSEPVGLDSHRYRCCGNGVVANVAEWIGIRIAEVDARWQKEGK
jgi:DNA-cytosine methyltransferase